MFFELEGSVRKAHVTSHDYPRAPLNVTFSTPSFCFFVGFFFCRDVGEGGRHLPGALEAAVAGERDALLPRVHDGVGSGGPDHAGLGAAAGADHARTHASAAHLSYGK